MRKVQEDEEEVDLKVFGSCVPPWILVTRRKADYEKSLGVGQVYIACGVG